ncbi:hypothetical protein NUBL17187_01670 [Klebsiella michiganensis]|nr:hypothetical protein NUBL17187_01670 [Klebsiella michiganensis]
MTTKPSHARKSQADKQLKTEQLKADRKQAISEESKSLIREMRKLGFAPRKGNVTQKHFERYAAYLETQAMANRAAGRGARVPAAWRSYVHAVRQDAVTGHQIHGIRQSSHNCNSPSVAGTNACG